MGKQKQTAQELVFEAVEYVSTVWTSEGKIRFDVVVSIYDDGRRIISASAWDYRGLSEESPHEQVGQYTIGFSFRSLRKAFAECQRVLPAIIAREIETVQQRRAKEAAGAEPTGGADA